MGYFKLGYNISGSIQVLSACSKKFECASLVFRLLGQTSTIVQIPGRDQAMNVIAYHACQHLFNVEFDRSQLGASVYYYSHRGVARNFIMRFPVY